ncbi:polysaccharide pyruvyl transferase family protein [Oculatella sp. LEGE 06141]|uniref:polysaccharide pyruvyl transferase family protein n=1 Tax=Oculatella sp. LEGE 06141 TaxID=1828648 RepID=UPI00187E0D6B|nr:polysaccharide pyruvyl transferase family protein [Oculatella sp. LEGE 06141]MBE9179512.1 polysaccharide pyruvyl transferase family protein [Oculatella sp. LEGE 06141]
MTLRGAVFGWYHNQNAGDDRIAQCIEMWLDDHQLTFLPHTETPPIEILQRSDYVILGGGSIANQVYGAFKDMRRWIAKVEIPVFGVSLTVSQHEAFKYELSSISQTGGLIWTRDRKTLEWLNFKDDDVIFGPDISWLYPRYFPHETRHDLVGVNFRPWDKVHWEPQSWNIALKQSLGDTAISWPLCFGKDADSSILKEILKVNPCSAEFDPTVPSRSKLVVAMRYHAIIFAIQAGTPFIAIDNTRKVRDLLEQVNLQHISVPLNDPSQFTPMLDYVSKNIDTSLLTQITQKMTTQTWEVANHVKQKIEESAYIYRERRKRLIFRISQKLSKLTS